MLTTEIIEVARVARDNSFRFENVPEAKIYGQPLPTLVSLQEFAGDMAVSPAKVFILSEESMTELAKSSGSHLAFNPFEFFLVSFGA